MVQRAHQTGAQNVMDSIPLLTFFSYIFLILNSYFQISTFNHCDNSIIRVHTETGKENPMTFYPIPWLQNEVKMDDQASFYRARFEGVDYHIYNTVESLLK